MCTRPRQYRKRFNDWGWDKNVKTREMKSIVRLQQRRKLLEPRKTALHFNVRNKVVPAEDIERWMKRNDISPNQAYSPASLTGE
jgi:hypothetical protein